MKLSIILIRCVLAACLLTMPVLAQTTTLRGLVTDESGGLVQGAKITLAGPGKLAKSGMSGNDGSYSFADLPSGSYTIHASAQGLALRQAAKIDLKPGTQTLNLLLNVAAEKQEVTVDDNGAPAVSTDAASNASAVILRGSDLDALSDNPDDLLVDLQALAGPAAGPNGGSIFIDGFSGGELPPKNAIREIRINQNPFSPEYDKLGFGRIEIFTKPGTDKFRGSVGYNFANDKWNSRNAYAAQKAPFRLNELSGTLSGPIGKKASFNLNLIREWVDNGNVVNGVILDSQMLVPTAFTATPVAALRRTGFTPRADYQLSTNHTLSVRYSYNRDIVRNAGTGGFNLAERGYHNNALSQTVQATETAVVNASTINETRFQYFRPENVSQANTLGAAISVLGAFNGGGNPLGRSINRQNTYEFQNYTSVLRKTHAWRFGVRLRGASETSISPQNFGGAFTFSGGLAPQLPLLDGAGQVSVNISSIESYRRTLIFQRQGLSATQIRQFGGGASQFTINTGNPLVTGSQFDAGLFAGDDWKPKPNLTVSLGLRYETQTNIHDWRDFAPRIGVAWAPGGGAGRARPKSVIRAGFGMFYDRFALGNILTAERFNGTLQQQFVIPYPDFFPNVPAPTALSGPVPPSTIQQVSAGLRAPYLMQSAVGFERQIPFNTTVAITYANTHGLHMLRSQDVNAPFPGSGLYPLGRAGLVVLMESSGLYNQNQLILNVNSRVNRQISLTGTYMYNRASSNTDSLGTFPANPYSMAGEYGRAATDMRHRVSLTGTVTVKWGIRLNPLLTASTGPPFDITAGRDLYGDTLFNGRPGIATDPNKPGVVPTKYGLLDPNPTPGEQLLPRNFGRGPGQIMLNMRVGRTFAFGGTREASAQLDSARGGAGGGVQGARNTPTSPFSMGGGQGGGGSSNRRYSFTVSMQIRNVTNHNNPGPIIGNITSPLFGQANQPAASGGGIFSESANNRRLELQTRFTF
ncbi:MAG TPA: carboxypeptidase regulatory-like domain-containing protein [Candidatus Solibacter sp.]|nr:carboxypeptidase regulatory-like domain-containing protein [Candidatus Solibacter sp.]